MKVSRCGHILFMLTQSLTLLNYEKVKYRIPTKLDLSTGDKEILEVKIEDEEGRLYKVRIEEI